MWPPCHGSAAGAPGRDRGHPKLMREPREASQEQEFGMESTYGAVTEQECRALQSHH